MSAPLRVIQWATGSVGRESLAGILMHPDLELDPGLAAREARIEIDALWTLGGFHPESWPRPRDGWTVSIEGDPSFRTHFMSLASLGRREATIDDHVQAASVATAM